MARQTPSPASSLERAVNIEKEGRDYFLYASQRAQNELARQTFQALAGRHGRHAEQIEQARRALAEDRRPDTPPALPPRTLFEQIVQRISQSAAPTAGDIAELRTAIVYSLKLRDVHASLTDAAIEDWERTLYNRLRQEEEALRLTLADTLNYLRSNFDITRPPALKQ